MAIYTPRGLKIRITVPHAFGLLARLHPKVTAFRVLKTTEGIESLPGMLAFIAGMVGFGMHLPPFHIGLMVVVCQCVGVFINAFFLYIVPGLVGLGTLYSYLANYGIFLAAVIITGFYLSGWQAVIAFFFGKMLAAIIGLFLEFWQARRYYKFTGNAITRSELSFFDAYRLHAKKIGVTTNVNLSDEEMKEERWAATFIQLATDWPEVVRRFG